MSFFKGDAGQPANQGGVNYNAALWDQTQRSFQQPGNRLGYESQQSTHSAYPPQTSNAGQQQQMYTTITPQMAQQLQHLRQTNPALYSQYAAQIQRNEQLHRAQQLHMAQQQRMTSLQPQYQPGYPGSFGGQQGMNQQGMGQQGMGQQGLTQQGIGAQSLGQQSLGHQSLGHQGMGPGSMLQGGLGQVGHGGLGQLAMRQQLYSQPQHVNSNDLRTQVREAHQSLGTRTARPPAPLRAKKRYQDESEGEEDDEDDEEEDDYRETRGVASHSSRPRRAAAQQAVQQIKSKYVHDDEEDEEEEEEEVPMDEGQYARSMALGIRTKPKQVNPAAERATPPTRMANGAQHSSGGNRRLSYAEEQDEEASGSEADEDARRAAVAAKNAAVAALLEPEELAEMDDEVERVISHRVPEDGEEVEGDKWANMEFWVKWKRWSYRHCSWDTLNTLSQLGGYKRVLNYCKRQDEQERARVNLSREEQELFDVERQMEEQLVQQHMELERVVSIRKEPEGKIGYLCKWRGLPYSEATWEPVDIIKEANASDKVDAFQERQFRIMERGTTVDQARSAMYAMRSLQEQPEWLRGGGKLRDYQLDGLNWLVYSWAKGNNSILADEMGLGKTVQCVSMIGFLAMQQKVMGPFLVVVPLSTVPNWIKEFNKWLPQVNTVVYVGDSKSREVIRKYEFTNTSTNANVRPHKFEVIITTYELVLKDAEILGTIYWNFLVVDEAHRLKNNDSALYQELSQWSFRNKLLVTGTPLQNSIKELWALLHFLEPAKFPSCSHFEETHSLQEAEGVTQLHAELKPHLLRRVIKDVERSLPPKKECILRVEMTPLQKQYYKYILSRNYRELNKGSGPQISLLNIIIELKKCCNHPFLFSTAEEEYRGDEKDLNAVDRLVRTSGKMVLLDKLMKSLKQNGHRVLIFSQMVRALDIISDYMRLRGFQHQRLDGSTPAATRHQAMEHFNAPGSQDFAFLLSTRAGGLGINLATADTVIIFDSDWNPQNDLQAMSRAHRIGQTETVNIYRFLTSGTVEEDILQRAKQKMVLDHLVIQRMDTSGRTVLDASGANTAKKMFGKDELAAILRFGAEELFKEDETKREQKQNEMLSEDLESILARAEVVHDGDKPTDGGELLNSFNVATFKADEDDAAFWNRLIPVTERPKNEPVAAFEELGARSTRYRGGDDYDGRDDTPASGAESDSGSEGGKRRRGGNGRARGRPFGRTSAAGPPVDGALARVDVWPPDCDINGQLSGKGRSITKRLSKKDANSFLKAVRRYGRIERMADIAQEVGSVLQDQPASARYALWWGLIRGCEKVERVASDKKSDVKDALLDWFGVGLKAQEISSFVKRMELLSQRIQAAKDPERHYRLEDVNLSMPKWGASCGWEAEDDQKLLLGCYWYGIGHWDEMARDERLRLGDKLALAAIERSRAKEAAVSSEHKHLPKGSHIDTRAHALLRKLQTVHEKGVVERAKPLRLSGRKRGAAAMTAHFPDDSDRAEILLGDDIMINVKKLRVLQRKGDEMERQKVVEKTRKYLASVGDRIEAVATNDRTRRRIWQFVSRFTENKMEGEKLEKVYQKIKTGKASAAAVHSTGVGTTDGNSLRETEDGELVDEEAEDPEAQHEPKRVRHEDWDGEKPPNWNNQRSRSARETAGKSWDGNSRREGSEGDKGEGDDGDGNEEQREASGDMAPADADPEDLLPSGSPADEGDQADGAPLET